MITRMIEIKCKCCAEPNNKSCRVESTRVWEGGGEFTFPHNFNHSSPAAEKYGQPSLNSLTMGRHGNICLRLNGIIGSPKARDCLKSRSIDVSILLLLLLSKLTDLVLKPEVQPEIA